MGAVRIDFRRVPPVESRSTVAAGRHLCRVAEVREGVGLDGSIRWSLRLEVEGGDHAGHTAAWDSFLWNEAGLPRLKRGLEGLGLDVGGILELSPSDLLGRRARVTLVETEAVCPTTGERVLRLRVPFGGYARVAEGGAP